MTETEAKQKWCPMGRTPARDEQGFAHSPAHNRSADGLRNIGACIGSDCMMWRQTGTVKLVNGKPIRYGDNYPEESIEKIQEGYCGLAGKA